MSYRYTFGDRVHGHVPENAPPDELLERFPLPRAYRPYRPARGKHSKSAEKAAATRNRKRYEASKFETG